MGTQIDKMEVTTGQRQVIKEQNKHYDEVMKESQVQGAIRSIKQDGEKGIESVMYEQCDNYENYAEYEKAMKRVAHKAYREYLNNTQEVDENEEHAKQVDENHNQQKWLEEQQS